MGAMRCALKAEMGKTKNRRPKDDITKLGLSAVPGFNGLYVEPGGRLFSVTELVQYEDRDGYMRINFFADGAKRRPGVHVVVALTYHPERGEEQTEVRHLNGDKKDNAPTNLAWGTRKENGEDKARHGSSKGERNGRCKLTVRQVVTIKQHLRHGKPVRWIATKFRVSKATINAIKSGRNWSWL